MISRIEQLHNSASHQTVWRLFVGLVLVLSGISIAFAGPRERAKTIHDRLAGVPATEAVLDTMTLQIQGGSNGVIAAAMTAMDNPGFATVTLKNFAAPWTNRDESAFVSLNDYTTLVIGMVINNQPFNEILTADRLYVDAGQSLPSPSRAWHSQSFFRV